MLCRNYVCDCVNCALGLNATECNRGQDLHAILPGPLGSRSFGRLPRQTPCLIRRQGQTYAKHLVALALEIQTTKYHDDSFGKGDLSLLCQEWVRNLLVAIDGAEESNRRTTEDDQA